MGPAKKHVLCLVDVEDVPLYLKVGEITMEEIIVPVYRCARGTTSLESFHEHVKVS